MALSYIEISATNWYIELLSRAITLQSMLILDLMRRGHV